MIITRGYGTGQLIITRGYGLTGLVAITKTKVIWLVSHITKAIRLNSPI